MVVRRVVAVLSVGVLGLGALSACTDDESDGPSSEPSTPSSSPSADEPEEPTEPERPAAMDNEDKAGAKAFVEYYWDVVEYAQKSGEVSALQDLSAKDCEACRAGISSVRKTLARAKRIRGGHKDVAIDSTRTLAAEDVRTFQVDHTVKSTSQIVVLKNGSREKYTASTTHYRIFAGRDRSQNWKVWRLEVPS